MSVYLGTHGRVELQRKFDGGEIRSTIDGSVLISTTASY